MLAKREGKMSTIVLVIVLVLIVGIVMGFAQAARRRRENPMRSLEALERQGQMGMPVGNRDEIAELLTRRQKITAIKRYREMTGVGLAEAKAAVEQMERELLSGQSLLMPAQPVMGSVGDVNDVEEGAALALLAEVRQLALSGKKIAAIKLYREKTGVGLKEAKDVVDRMA
jgi:ribosomal protein L7/L12